MSENCLLYREEEGEGEEGEEGDMEGLIGNRGGVLCGVSLSVCGHEETQAFSRDGSSHYSLSTGILPSLGARSNRTVQLRRLIVSPHDPCYR